ncbi:unnamed protein product [Prunus armeniaca]
MLLKKTLFWNLIELFYHQRIDMNNMNKSDLDLVQLLKKFDPDTKSFKFGTKSFQIIGNAVTQILRLPNEGKSVKLVNDRTNIIQPILGKEKETPAILKWSLVELHTRFNQIKDLNDIERKTTREEEDIVEKFPFNMQKKEKEDDEGQQGEAEEAEDQGKPDDEIQDLLVKSMTDQINYHQRQDPSFVCPERLQLWKDEINEDSGKKMKELWDIFIQGEKRSKELEAQLATYVEKLDNEEYVIATMTVESTVQLQEIQNLKRRIAELEGKETRIDMEKIAKKKKIEEKYKVEIQSLLSDPTIFEMEMDLPTTQPTQPVEEKEEEKKEEEKQQEEKEEEKK